MHVLAFGTTLATLSSAVRAHNEARLGASRVPEYGLPRELRESNTLARSSSNPTNQSGSILSEVNRYRSAKNRVQEQPNVDGQCGAKDGGCAKGYCCSPEVSNRNDFRSMSNTENTGLVWSRI
jgi:hypothetical protein